MDHRSVYFKDNTVSLIESYIGKGVVTNYSQAVALAISIISDYFSDEQLLTESIIRLTSAKRGPKHSKIRENRKNEQQI